MDDYIKFLNAYKSTNRIKILVNVFIDDPLNKKLLWFLWLLVLCIFIASIITNNKILVFISMIPAFFGALVYRKELYVTYKYILTDDVCLGFAKEYALNYQGLRYFIFKDNLILDVDTIRNYLDININYKCNKSIRNNWFVASLITILAVISSQIISGFSKEILLFSLFLVFVLILYSVMLLQAFTSSDERSEEMFRFLLWYEMDMKNNV